MFPPVLLNVPPASGYSPPPRSATGVASTLPYVTPAFSLTIPGTPAIRYCSISGIASSGCGGQSTTTVTEEHTATVTVSIQLPTSIGTGSSPINGSTTSETVKCLSNADAASPSVENTGEVQPFAPTGSLYANASVSSPAGAGSRDDTSTLSFTYAAISSTDDGLPKTLSTVDALDIGSSTLQSSTWEASVSTSSSAANAVPTSSSGTNRDSSSLDSRSGEIWAGACIDTVPRAKALPGRTFYDFDGKTVKDPVVTLADAGVNAFRVQAFRDQCLGPEPFATSTSPLDDEDDFLLDFGCIDVKVNIAKQATGLRMRMELTINQGLNIPKAMEAFSYEQMVQEVQKETKRQLQPFLDAGIVPDVILLENEGTDGFLFHEEATGHNRGQNDGKVSEDVVNQERCGQIPTGKMDSCPQLAGYYKAEVIACNEAIKAAGFPTDTVRYGLHSHGQYVQWKESVVHGPQRASETLMKKIDGSPCDGPSAIPANLLATNASEVLTIAGFSAYADPMRPIDINDATSLRATLSRLEDTLMQIQSCSEQEYGRYPSGLFQGQYRL
ncbi:MAG: hypothetical protein Q9169_001272 [Polycauliona sp. 2 TL-2023]